MYDNKKTFMVSKFFLKGIKLFLVKHEENDSKNVVRGVYIEKEGVWILKSSQLELQPLLL